MSHRVGRRSAAAFVIALVVLAGSAAPGTASEGGSGATILIAGDIATCTGDGDARTAALIAGRPGIVMTAGDNVYPTATAGAFRDCYGPTWGRFRSRTRPALGNHDWATSDAGAYFAYFGRRAGPRGRGWYAFDAGGWRIHVLSTQPCFSGSRRHNGCSRGSPQYRWLAADLAEHPRACSMAVAHHPRFSSGPHGNTTRTWPLLALLLDAHTEVIVNGHDHIYERFALARPDGDPDPDNGMRQFIVGTGGGGRYAVGAKPAPNSEVRDGSSYGILELRLEADAYRWRFLRVDGSVGDRGSDRCRPMPDAVTGGPPGQALPPTTRWSRGRAWE